tara:strand:+ start:7817 stop:8833 length:1017 start_codon:yes stop_codon:yes gene_type:complete
MIKKFFLFWLLICSFSFIEGVEVFDLQNTYTVEIGLTGSDKASIEVGMRKALKNLMIQITGSTSVASDRKLDNLYKNPQQYINQYKLKVIEEVVNANFFFEGNRIRNYLSDNQLPLWLPNELLVLAYLPCDLNSSASFLDNIDRESCNTLNDSLSILSKQRLVKLTSPILDFKDLAYLDALSSISYSAFMDKTIKRYNLENWIVCFNRDDFGVILEKAKCISSISDKQANVELVFNKLINYINSANSLVVNKKESTSSKVSIEGIYDYLTLEKITEELRSQILVTDLNLDSINKGSIDYKLSTYGTVEDLERLLRINSNFIQLENSSKNRLVYKYIKI